MGGFCGGGAFSSGWFWFVDDFLVGSDVVGLFWICLGFGVFFFPLGFVAGGGFRYGVDLQWRMLWFFGFAVEDVIGFLDLGLDAWFGWVFMAGGGNSRSEVREGEWGFGCENQKNHQEGEWESRFVRKKDKKRKV